MSAYDKFIKLQNEVKSFKSAELFSLGENSVIVKNTNTGALYDIPITEDENGITFHCENGEVVTGRNPDKNAKFFENRDMFQKSVKDIFIAEDFDAALATLKETIQTLPSVEILPEVTEETPEVSVYEGILDNQVNEYNKQRREFSTTLALFDGSNNLVDQDVNSASLNKAVEESNAEFESFEQDVTKFVTFQNELTTILDNQKITNYVLEHVNFDENIRMEIPKVLVTAKHALHEDINVIDATKQIVTAFETAFNEDTTPSSKAPFIFNYAQNDRERPTFLKFRMGTFTVEDAMTLLEELDQTLAKIGDLNDEDLMFISNQKYIVEYMMRTRKISDRMMIKVIEDFNARFNSKDAEDDYLQSQFGFKDRDEAKMANIIGKSDRGNA